MKFIRITIFLLISLSLLLSPNFVFTSINNWQKGVSIRPSWDTDFSSESFRKSVDNANSANVNYITLIIPYHQANPYSTDIYKTWNTPTDASLISATQYIHSKGMAVNFKIHMENDNGEWRAYINPGDRTKWFGNYKNVLATYATLAEQHGVEQITIGAELINMTADDANGSNTQNWQNLIGYIRTIYSGKLTYSANWGAKGLWVDEKNRIKFWGALDSIGVSAYFPLTTNDTSVEAYTAKWDEVRKNDLEPLRNQYNKPILFTEVGYRSMNWAQWEPFNYWSDGAFDEGNQARLYEALFSYWNSYGYMIGVQLWDWNSNPNAGGQGNKDFTPQHKLAEQTMRTWFAGGSTPPPPPSEVTFNQSTTVNPTMPQINTAVSINTQISAGNSSINNTIVDIEIYNEQQQKVHQKFYSNQNFTPNETKTFDLSWTPNSSGSYTISVGVFNSDWSSNYMWKSGVASISVTESNNPPPPPPSASTVNIWWPSEGGTLSGTQPFKAMLEGAHIDSYTMYWQVHGGVLNMMGNSNVDYPHKESLVDVSTWGWNGVGPYKLTFIAKDASGKILAQSSRNIYKY
jgi:hypothetical protein